jgi:hypothetical protein
MSALFDNAVDSLRVGVQFYLDSESRSTHKHAILTIFHSIELFLKEYLARAHPILIYRDIDKKISEDSQTVGLKEIIARLDNLSLAIPESERKVIENIQRRRNRIEHHRYDQTEEDAAILAESLRFIIFFVEEVLRERLDEHLELGILDRVRQAVFDYRERLGLADYRLERWLRETFPAWDPTQADAPDEFTGTLRCPRCTQDYLVMEGGAPVYCHYCNRAVDAEVCEHCGQTNYRGVTCPCVLYFEDEDDA